MGVVVVLLQSHWSCRPPWQKRERMVRGARGGTVLQVVLHVDRLLVRGVHLLAVKRQEGRQRKAVVTTSGSPSRCWTRWTGPRGQRCRRGRSRRQRRVGGVKEAVLVLSHPSSHRRKRQAMEGRRGCGRVKGRDRERMGRGACMRV